MVRMIDAKTNQIIRDTLLEQLVGKLFATMIDYSISFICGAVGMFFIYKGSSNLIVMLISDVKESSSIVENNNLTNINNNNTLAPTTQSNLKFKNIYKWIMTFLSSFKKQFKTLYFGGLIGIGIWIISQPLLLQLYKLNQNVIYYVH